MRKADLVLSIFPGIDLFGRGFELESYCVVRGPDPLTGGDIRDFHPPAGAFRGVIGGPPCQDFSCARRAAPTGHGEHMLAEFRRVVMEAIPEWWLMENVPRVPDMRISGYTHQRIDITARQCGLPQMRRRHFQFGSRAGMALSIAPPATMPEVTEPAAMASEGNKPWRRDWTRFCAAQGLSPAPALDSLHLTARYRAVGNGVPIPMARLMARAIRQMRPAGNLRLCECSCGREVKGKAYLAGPACRKRMERRRSQA